MKIVEQLPGESDLDFAVRAIEQSRDVHVEWVAWIDHVESCERCRSPENAETIRVAGDRAHHEGCIAKYEHVLRVLRGTLDSAPAPA